MQNTVQIMGILNVTPDSFSDGGQWNQAAGMQARIETMLSQQVDIIDIGGESTRPFADVVPEMEELARVLPAVQAVRRLSTVPISIDTTKATVARECLQAGADIINDISALRYDPAMVEVLGEWAKPVVIMHMQGNPADMQVRPQYDNVIDEICAFFAERLAWLQEHGIGPKRVILDPGIGFGKTLDHNLDILRNISKFKEFGCPVLIGHSRKSFLGQLLELPVEQRDCPTAVVSALAAAAGADILRVHEVLLTRQALALQQALLPLSAARQCQC